MDRTQIKAEFLLQIAIQPLLLVVTGCYPAVVAGCSVTGCCLLMQVAIQPLRDGTDLRDNVQIALAMFKENCGLAPISNIKQCIRMLVTRISASSDNASLQLVMKGEVSPAHFFL